MKTRFSHDIFISYSSADMQTAMDICSGLEEKGMKCWIAPRDVVAGEGLPFDMFRKRHAVPLGHRRTQHSIQ